MHGNDTKTGKEILQQSVRKPAQSSSIMHLLVQVLHVPVLEAFIQFVQVLSDFIAPQTRFRSLFG